MVRYFCSGDTFSKPKAAAYFDDGGRKKSLLYQNRATFLEKGAAEKESEENAAVKCRVEPAAAAEAAYRWGK